MDARAIQTPETFISLPITPGFLWTVLLVSIVLFSIISWMFVHHWKYYGIAENNRIFVEGVYFVIAVILFVLMVIFLGMYTFTI